MIQFLTMSVMIIETWHEKSSFSDWWIAAQKYLRWRESFWWFV